MPWSCPIGEPAATGIRRRVARLVPDLTGLW